VNRLSIVPVCLAFAATAFVVAGTANAEIPKMSKEELQKFASHALVGTIEQTYERKETRRDYEYVYGVAEVNVDRVSQGEEIEEGDRVFVRYWKKRWTGPGNPSPGHYGHWNIPDSSDKAEIYIKGDRKTGYDVLSPNGFFKLTKQP